MVASLQARLEDRKAEKVVAKRPAAAMSRDATKRARPAELDPSAPAMPDIDAQQAPMTVHGSRVYHDAKRKAWRVKLATKPTHDRAFAWGSQPEAAWAKVVQFCESQQEQSSR
jgi:hypothetical protein